MRPTDKKPVNEIIDGINFNARHFASMSKAEGTAALIVEAKGHDMDASPDWASKAYDKLKEKVANADKPPSEVKDAQAKLELPK